MTRILRLGLMAAALMFVALLPATAAGPPACAPGAQSLEEARVFLSENAGEVLAIIDVEGLQADQLVVVRYRGEVVVGGFLEDCASTGAVAFTMTLPGRERPPPATSLPARVTAIAPDAFRDDVRELRLLARPPT